MRGADVHTIRPIELPVPDRPIGDSVAAVRADAAAETAWSLRSMATADDDVTEIEQAFRLLRAGRKPAKGPVVPAGDRARMLARMCRASVAFFAQEVLRGPPESPYDGRFLVAEHHEQWDDLLMRYRRLCIEAARDHGKTFFFDFAYPLWQLFHRPNTIGFIFSASAPQAVRILDDIKEEIESNPRLRWLIPKRSRGVQWSSTAIQCSNGARIYARGFGTRVRGAHPHWMVVDDGLNDETLYSETVRNKQIDYYYSAISNMLVPGGQLVVVGTPFHAQDLYGDLEANEEYHFARFPALDPTGRALWPDRYDGELLGRKQREIGSVRFTREFQCQPIADDMSLFPGYLFVGEPVEQPTVRLGMELAFWKSLGVETIVMGVDFALSSSARADYTVIWVMGTDRHGNRWIIDIVRGHGAAYQAQLSKIIELARRYEPGLVFVEANQAQRIFGDELIRLTDLPIHKVTTGTEKHSLDRGVPSLRVLLENQKFRIPRGDERSVRLTNCWRDEMRAFTWAGGKLASVVNHDDTVMACWFAEQAIRHGGFGFDFGDDTEYSDAESGERHKRTPEEARMGTRPEDMYDAEPGDPAWTEEWDMPLMRSESGEPVDLAGDWE